MITPNRTFQIARRTLAFSAVLSMGFAVAQAQDAVAPPVTAQPTLNFQLPVSVPAANFSSSAAENDATNVSVADSKNPFDFLAVAGTQPPPRRTYNRPRYRGGNTNADGSNKYAFVVGGGLGVPVGDTHTYLTPSWGLQVGGGRNFNKTFGVMLQFDYDNFGFQGSTLNNQFNLYNKIIGYYNATVPVSQQVAPLTSLDGSSHVWSFTLNPTYNFYSGEGMGAYLVGGVGFYHKVANFTVPAVGTYCDYYYGCYQYQANQSIDQYTSNAPGFNGGLGFTYKLSHFSNQRLFAEARYVYIVNQQRAGVTNATVNPVNASVYNDYPANSNRTSYIPVKFGLRF